MGSSVITLGIFLVGLAIACNAEEVPVFVWGDLEYKTRSANPLLRTTSAELEHELRAELTNRQTLVAFVEETLSVEDLSRRDSSGATLLPYLRSNLKDSLYFPAVNSPVAALSKVADVEHTDRIRLTTDGLSGQIRDTSSVVIIELADARDDEPRADMLRRHDRFMRETIDKMREGSEVVAVYTARYPSWTVPEELDGGRFRRQLKQAEEAASNSSSDIKVFNNTHLLFAISSIVVKKTTGSPVTLSLGTGPAVTTNDTHIVATLTDAQYKVTLTFSDSLDFDGYWFMNEASVTEISGGAEEKFIIEQVYAPNNFSYHCGPGLTVTAVNGTFNLALNDIQVQPFFYGNSDKFGDYYDCVGFFSMPIWSGLFVVTLLLAIFFYGVVNMMDIRTMDRFDDPKGKTITISATE